MLFPFSRFCRFPSSEFLVPLFPLHQPRQSMRSPPATILLRPLHAGGYDGTTGIMGQADNVQNG